MTLNTFWLGRTRVCKQDFKMKGHKCRSGQSSKLFYSANKSHVRLILFLRINMTEKNFCHIGNQTHDFGTICLSHRSGMLYHYSKSQVHQCIVANPTYVYISWINDFNQQRDKNRAKSTHDLGTNHLAYYAMII